MSKNPIYLILLFSVLFSACTDPYKLQTTSFEEAIVIEATITNELKRQEIKVSKTYKLEETGPSSVTNATVVVTDDAGNTYTFTPENGTYLSDEIFQAVAGRTYKLNVTTSDGKSYSSKNEQLTAVSEITSVTATDEIVASERGVQIRVNSFDPTGNAKYYRYKYDETYKVIAPKWVGSYAIISEDLNTTTWSSTDYIQIHPRTYEARTCYSSNSSTNINVATTSTLSEDRIENYPVRFISAQNDIISHRYSINVIQYVQNLESYTFYKTLGEISGTGGSILSQNQPGFFSGNIYSDSDPDEKVIGFFEVSSVSQQRIFFNHDDILPDLAEPPFFMNCDVITLDANDFSRDSNQGGILRSNLDSGALLYFSNLENIYEVVPKQCGDCTSFSSNVVPSFWIE